MIKPRAIKLDEVPGGPSPGTMLCVVDDIADGGAKKLLFKDGELHFEMFVQRRGEGLFAYKNSCPHARLPLDFRPANSSTLKKSISFASIMARNFGWKTDSACTAFAKENISAQSKSASSTA